MACLQTAMVADIPDPAPTETAMPEEIESGAVFEVPTAESQTLTAKTCARVTAVKSLNLREQPNEKAIVIYWLQANDVVKVIGRVGEWWLVEADSFKGYARAKYLQETECE